MKIYIFIDYQNLKMGIGKNNRNFSGEIIYKGWKIDMRRFFVYITDKFKPCKVILFLGYIKEKQILYDKLISYGYSIVFKPTVKNGLLYKGNVDIEIAIESISKIHEYKKAILITGDGDFYSLIKYLKKKKKFYKLLIPNRYRYSSLFGEFSNCMEFLEDLQKKVGVSH